ncbi:MAG: S41 family peptidase [Rikenellaceae bacterium]|nr:S41 family peptidase [Rikenellaceae bacterium]
MMKLKDKIKKPLIAATVAVGAILLISAANSDFRLGRNMQILVDVYRELNLFYVDEPDQDKLLMDAVEGMTSSLDPYTEYLPEEDMEQFEMMTTGKYGGIGSLIRQKGDWVYFAQPYRGFPADRSGIVIGDKILAIDGVDAEGMDTEKVSSLLKGDPGTVVSVTVEKFYTGKTETLEITRERISVSGVPYYGFVNDSIGYIRHSDFTEDCSSDMRNALMELRKDGRLKGLVLDYRNNGGGILQEAVKILSMFVPRGTEVVSMRGRQPESTAVFRTESDPIDTEIPIVVLVNGGSASAAEIVSGALQDLDRAVILGQRTYGKGLVQSPRPVGYNSYLKVTTAKYYIPSGRCIQAIDYARRNDDGSVSYIPDSLINEYTTTAGRRVYDGGGIMPDVVTSSQYVSRFTMMAYALGYLDDFADEYVKRHREPVDVESFRLSDADYRWFIEFMADKPMEYSSETAQALKTLTERAQKELYYDRIEGEIERLTALLQDDKQGNLTLYRDQIAEILEDDIILRQHYQQGVIRHSTFTDEEISEAVGLLCDPARYGYITTEQDTSRK